MVVSAHAQNAIVTDGTVGPRVLIDGADSVIGAELGRVEGSNLFHSFEQFDVGTGSRATFVGPDSLTNVISRVTGGGASLINGTLASTIGRADVWFVNPDGVIFGPGASLDVPAGFHVSGAPEVRFADGSVFSAIDVDGSSLSVAPPESFGFLSGQNGGIIIDGSSLRSREGEALSVVSAGILIAGGADIRSPAGRLTLVSADGDATIDPGRVRERPDVTNLLRIDEGSFLTTTGTGAGQLTLAGGSISIVNGTSVFADNTGPMPAPGGAQIFARDLVISGGSQLSSEALSLGAAGRVNVQADSLAIEGADGVRTGVFARAFFDSAGDGGGIEISANEVALSNGAEIDANTLSTGLGGSVVIATGTLRVDSSLISSGGSRVSSGDAGSVSITAQSVDVTNQGQITSTTSGAGRGGVVTVDAERLTIDAGGVAGRLTGIAVNSEELSTNDAGTVLVRGGLLALNDGGQISTSTRSIGNAGDIVVGVSNLIIDGQSSDVSTGIFSNALAESAGDGGQIDISATEVVLANGAEIETNTGSTGRGGSVVITADTLQIDSSIISSGGTRESSGDSGSVSITAEVMDVTNQGQIASTTLGAGRGGVVTVDANQLTIDAGGVGGRLTGISVTSELSSTNDAGTAFVNGGLLTLNNGGQISSSTRSIGGAGDIVVDVDSLIVDGIFSGVSTGIFSSALAGSSGDAGNISIAAESVDLRNNGGIRSATFGIGDAGRISITADLLSLENLATIGSVAEFGSEGRAGVVSIQSRGIEIARQGQILSSTFAEGDAGQIVVVADSITISDGEGDIITGIASTAESGSSGQAGSIAVVANNISIADDGTITTSAASTGNAGAVEVTADRLELVRRAGIGSNTFGSGDGGSVQVRGGTLDIQDQGQISSNTFAGGRAGSVDVIARDLRIDANGVGGALTGIASTAEAESTNDAGSVLVQSDLLRVLDGGQISATTRSTGNAGTVTVDAQTLVIDGGAGTDGVATGILNNAADSSTGAAGTVDVTAGRLELSRNARIASNTESRGNAGFVRVRADSIDIQSQSQITSTTNGAGRAGSVDVIGRDIRIDAGGVGGVLTGIASTAEAGSANAAGSIVVQSEVLRVLDGGQISATTRSIGDAGTVTVDVHSLVIDDKFGPAVTGIFNNAASGSEGDAGGIFVSGDDVQILNGASIASSTASIGNAGLVSITSDRLRVDAQAGVQSNASPGSTGNAGAIQVNARDIELRDQSQIITSTFAAGNAGTVTIDGGRLTIDANGKGGRLTGIASNAEEASGGNAGQISVTVDEVRLLDGGQVSTQTSSIGNAGDIIIDAGAISIDGGNVDLAATGVFSDANADSLGNAGAVTIRSTGPFLLANDALVSSESFGRGLAGDVFLSGQGVRIDSSSVSTSGASSAGGRIDISASQDVRLDRAVVTTSGALPAEGASLLAIEAPFVEILNQSRVLSLAGGETVDPSVGLQTGEASVNGVITVVSDDSEIAASTEVVVQGLDSEVGSGLQINAAVPRDIDRLLSSACAVTNADNSSSFTRRGQRAIIDSPLSTLSSAAMPTHSGSAC